MLGAGAFGKVYLTKNKHNPDVQVAIKVMNKRKLKDELDAIKQEVMILNTLDHPNIVKYYETYDDPKNIYLVMEHISGGELFDKIAQQENQVFTEIQAAEYMKELFGALAHMHAQGIVHRDIKPENIMLDENESLKLIDFGLSKIQSDKKSMKTFAGTPYYMAPEVMEGSGYGMQCDVWSAGVLLYVFMSGYLPFQGANRDEVFSKIRGGKFHFNHEEFTEVSQEAKELIKQLLVVDPKKRLSAQGALNHPWIKNYKKRAQSGTGPQFDVNVLLRLREYKGVSKLKQAATNMLVKMANKSQIENLKKDFEAIDKDGTHMITPEELKQAIKKSQIGIQDAEIDRIINEVDYHGNNKINYTEFIIATMDVKQFLDDSNLQAIFNQFDTDGSGTITKDNIIVAMQKIGQTITQEDLDQIMQEHDLENNGVISLEEFKALMLGIDNTRDMKEME